MDIFFADDSTQKGVREGMGTVVALGGVFVDESAIRPLSLAVDRIAASYGVPKGEELKWSPRKRTWIHTNLHGNARTDCYCAVLEAAAAHEARGIVVCWDTQRTTLKGEMAFGKCVDFLFERISVHLEKRRTSAIIVADRPGGGKDQEVAFLSDFLSLVEKGTEYVVPDRVVMNVVTTPSHLQRLLQVADLVTGVTTAIVCGQYKYAAPVFEKVHPLLIPNYFGTIGGTGLKLFPDDLQNLYFHVLKEDTYWKVGQGVGRGLPDSGFPYHMNEFAINGTVD